MSAALVASGHELGCHTFSHQPCWRLSAAELDEDLDRNARSSRFALGEKPFVTFAYPYGLASAAAKRLVAARFAAVRHIRKGINAGTIDMAELRANEISADTPAQALNRLIDRCRDRNGWLLLFTHDISETPSPWGCTPALFAELVERAVASGCSVLPVGDAAAAITGTGTTDETGDAAPCGAADRIEMTLRVTLIAFEIPYPPVHGGRLDVWRRMTAMARMGVEIQLIGWRKTPLGEDEETIVRRYVRDVHVLPFLGGMVGAAVRALALARFPLEVTSRLQFGRPWQSLKARSRSART